MGPNPFIAIFADLPQGRSNFISSNKQASMHSYGKSIPNRNNQASSPFSER